ncbi:hypothetical protein CHS0354_002553 [Potamilus streckersoni]|uniref:TIR domain-containing protein n=1 Tax=Potamilus streckersoni TaxID=2493646 RepID=A0AAE0VGB9_9BIVA|nr:hypothetical protein CHS0354_002553 [Potamilus streckersoni]
MGSLVSVDVRVAVDGQRVAVDGQNILTEEEMEIRKEKILKDLNKAINKIKQISKFRTKDGKWNRDLLKSLDVFFKSYLSIKNIGPLQYNKIRNYLLEAGKMLSKSKSTSVICKVIMEGLKTGYRNKGGKTDAEQFQAIADSFLTLMNYSDCTPEVTYDIAEEPNFLETMKGILTTTLPAHMQAKAQPDDEKLMKWSLTICYNISIMDDNIHRLRSIDIVPVLSSLLYAKVDIYRLSALSTLANIIDEEESTEILQKKPEVIEFLLKKLGLAVIDPHHRHLGWSAEECARTVCRLARNDANKKLLVEKGCLLHLFKLANDGTVEEQREAVGAMQILAFEKENHSKILDDSEIHIADLLKEMTENSPDNQVRRAADGTLWILREEIQKKKDKHAMSTLEQKNRSATPTMQLKESPGAPNRKGHIMISYQWSDQKMLMKIRDILKEHGYAVWMDIDNMTGSTVVAMAEAVEEAHIFLMCMSRKYKISPNCQSEADYAYQLKKKIVPLKMENGYKPDGWLGFLAGTRLFFDFSEKYPFDEKIKELLREIANCYKD